MICSIGRKLDESREASILRTELYSGILSFGLIGRGRDAVMFRSSGEQMLVAHADCKV